MTCDQVSKSCLIRSKSRYIADDRVLSQNHAETLMVKVHTDQASVSSNLAAEEEDTDIGIKVSSWSVSTNTSTIASQKEVEDITELVEQLANSYSNYTKASCPGAGKRKRRLCLPESLYIHASVRIMKDDNFSITFDAKAALSEWAQCHSNLTDDVPEYRGVSILKSIDSKLWSKSQRFIPTDFEYDWSFSTPYSGTGDWIPCIESGFDMTLLTDRSLPILYYDDVKLYEDDMHDNGYTSLTCKIRVMPSCLLFLMTLFVRIDYILVRVKETRIFTTFDDNSHCLWREISWKECQWNDLNKYRLPEQIQPWRIENNTFDEKELLLHQQNLQNMIRSLPETALPSDLAKVSYLKFY